MTEPKPERADVVIAVPVLTINGGAGEPDKKEESHACERKTV